MLRAALAIVIGGVVLLACGAPGRAPISHRQPSTAPPPGFAPAPGPSEIRQPLVAGVPHFTLLDLVEVTPDGKSALTRDVSGSVRLWPALDGSQEPVVVPLRGARDLAFAAHPDGWTVAGIDSSGAARILRIRKDGQ